MMEDPSSSAANDAGDHPSRENNDCLRDVPDWLYLLRELYDLYLRSSAGGSQRIRSHQRVVRERISKTIESNPAFQIGEPIKKPVCAHLKRALDQGRLQRTATVIRAIESISDELSWMYGYERLPKHLTEKFAYAEVVGPNGPVLSKELILGLVLFAPKCVYPAHSHDGITESYFCLSGSVFRERRRRLRAWLADFQPAGPKPSHHGRGPRTLLAGLCLGRFGRDTRRPQARLHPQPREGAADMSVRYEWASPPFSQGVRASRRSNG